MKKKIASIMLGIIAILISIALLVSIILYILPLPPKPEIEYGEFPFHLEYEVNGQRVIVQDKIIYKYNGVYITEGGIYNSWQERLASGKKRVTLLKISETIEIYYPIGSSSYYMENGGYSHSFPNAVFYETLKNGFIDGPPIDADELYSKYKIKLLKWDYTKPIINRFR